MNDILRKLGITENFKRDNGDNIIRHGIKYSDKKHHYTLPEMILMDVAPEMLEALILILNNPSTFPFNYCEYARTVIEKATGKSWKEIKELLNERLDK